MSDSNSSPVGSTRSPDIEKAALDNVEQVHTNERVLGHTNYHEKHGLRTYGDGEDHDHEPPMSFKRAMSLTAMALLWTGSKIPVYQFGGIPPYIYADLGGTDRWIWFVLANLLSLAAVCPFVGSLSDLMGRRYVAILGAAFVVLGMIICSTAHTMNIFISGMVFAGVGAGINELTALAVTSELAPTAKRGKYVAILILTIIPFCPSVLWGQLIASKYPSAWRWVGLLCGIYNFIGLLLTAFFYFPPPRINSQGLSRNQILGQIDWVGGALSIPGMILMFWPTQAFNVYGHDPIGVGIRGLPVGFSILAGCCIVLWLLSTFRGHKRELLIISSVLMTAGCGALSIGRIDNLYQLWGLLVVAGVGIGGIVVPASIITTIICPDDLIATIAALTLAIRVIGGSIGYCVYYNVFVSKFVPAAVYYIGGAMKTKLNITDVDVITEAIGITGISLLPLLNELPGIKGIPGAYELVVEAGQIAYAEAYKYMYYVSIAFGIVSIVASVFLGDIGKYMDDHVAVVMH
ncbi:hypothetical protein LTR01_008960 [Friedmanniomyces endolithicus]|nr:hypothetical protein LTR01_008960 [Friedmanniomyces endolithicus]KAK0822820.1 hypothetical protein LTR73_009017 [Friedmanniomyces endolithicus]